MRACLLSLVLSLEAMAQGLSLAELHRANERFVSVDFRVDVKTLPASERQALALLLRAARSFDPLFLRQVWAENETVLMRLAQDSTPLGRERLRAFLLNKGPWSRLDGDAAFLPDVPPKPGE